MNLALPPRRSRKANPCACSLQRQLERKGEFFKCRCAAAGTWRSDLLSEDSIQKPESIRRAAQKMGKVKLLETLEKGFGNAGEDPQKRRF